MLDTKYELFSIISFKWIPSFPKFRVHIKCFTLNIEQWTLHVERMRMNIIQHIVYGTLANLWLIA